MKAYLNPQITTASPHIALLFQLSLSALTAVFYGQCYSATSELSEYFISSPQSMSGWSTVLFSIPEIP